MTGKLKMKMISEKEITLNIFRNKTNKTKTRLQYSFAYYLNVLSVRVFRKYFRSCWVLQKVKIENASIYTTNPVIRCTLTPPPSASYKNIFWLPPTPVLYKTIFWHYPPPP